MPLFLLTTYTGGASAVGHTKGGVPTPTTSLKGFSSNRFASQVVKTAGTSRLASRSSPPVLRRGYGRARISQPCFTSISRASGNSILASGAGTVAIPSLLSPTGRRTLLTQLELVCDYFMLISGCRRRFCSPRIALRRQLAERSRLAAADYGLAANRWNCRLWLRIPNLGMLTDLLPSSKPVKSRTTDMLNRSLHASAGLG